MVMETLRTSEPTLRLELTQGKHLAATLTPIPRDIDLIGLLAILEREVNRRRRSLDGSAGEFGEKGLRALVRERASVTNRRGTSDRRGAPRIVASRHAR